MLYKIIKIITMKKIKKALLLALGLLPLTAVVDAAPSDDSRDETSLLSSAEPQWKKSRFSIEAQSGSRTIGTFDALIPLLGDNDFMFYSNLKAKVGTSTQTSTGTAFEGNFGLGIRRVNDAETAIYGIYSYFDYLKSVNDNTFQQVTVGAERLGLTWDFRANVYLPIGTKEYNHTTYQQGVIDNHTLIAYYNTNKERAFAGGDIEAGRTLGTNRLRGYVGAYSFGEDLTGPRIRATYQLNDAIQLNAAVQYDNTNQFQYLLGIRYSIGGAKAKNPNSIYNRLTSEVVRDLDIKTTSKISEGVLVEPDKIWFVDPQGNDSGVGTSDSPFKTIEEAVSKAPENAVIFIKGDSDAAHQLKDILTLKDGQTLWGGSNNLYWNFAADKPEFIGSDSAPLIQEAMGVRQTLAGSIDVANNSSIYGLNIIGNDLGNQAQGISVNNKQNVTLYDVNVSGYKTETAEKFSGLNITGDSTVTVNQSSFNNNDIGIQMNGGLLTTDNVTAANNLIHGFNLISGTANIHNSTFNDNGDTDKLKDSTTKLSELNSAIRIGSNVSQAVLNASNITVNNNAGGIELIGGQLNINNGFASNNDRSTIDGNLGYGILIHDNDGAAGDLIRNASIMNTDITNTQRLSHDEVDLVTSGHGIMSENATSLYLENVAANNNAGNGIWHREGNFTGNSIIVTGNGSDSSHDINTDTDVDHFTYGLRIDSNNLDNASIVNLNNVTIKDSIAQGLVVTGGNVDINNLVSENNLDGVLLAHGTLNLSNAIIRDNNRFGIYFREDSQAVDLFNPNELTVTDSIIVGTKNNYEDAFQRGSGHGIVIEPTSEMILNNITRIQNTKIISNQGLGIYMTNHSRVIVTDSSINANAFANNKLTNIGGRDSGNIKAGGIYKEYSATASKYAVGPLTVLNSEIVDNYGSGLIYYDGEELQQDPTVRIADTRIQNNSGVGVRLVAGSIIDSTITNNSEKSQLVAIFNPDPGNGQPMIIPKVDITNSDIDYTIIDPYV